MKKSLCVVIMLMLFTSAFAQESPNITDRPPKTRSLSLGVLNGTGLVGLEYEQMFTNHLAFTAGAGFPGYNGGLNYHFMESIDSHFLSLTANNLGFVPDLSLTYIELALNVRFLKFMQASVGGAYVVYTGQTYKEEYEKEYDEEIPLAYLTYSIGVYVAF